MGRFPRAGPGPGPGGQRPPPELGHHRPLPDRRVAGLGVLTVKKRRPLVILADLYVLPLFFVFSLDLFGSFRPFVVVSFVIYLLFNCHIGTTICFWLFGFLVV